MAEESEDERTSGGGTPFLHPSFVGAAVVVLVILLLGVVVAVRVARSDAGPTEPVTAQTGSPVPLSPAPSVSGSAATSICGLRAPDTAKIPEAPSAIGPPAVWQYEGTTAYPTSQEFGPAKSSPGGYRYCFQSTPTGALFATANAVAQGASSDEGTVGSWAEYFVSDGPGRGKILAELNQPRSTSAGVRMSIVGFRMLSYTGSTARVDIALETSGSSKTVLASAVYELVWEAGDWKLNSEAPLPFNFGTIPNAAGYVSWGA